MDVTIIGAGNVAWHLAPALDNCGFAIKHVYNRTPVGAKQLIKRLYHSSQLNSLDFSALETRLFILCASDDAMEEIIDEIVLPENATLIHTSGSKPMELLENAAPVSSGVLYPLQTFSKTRKVDFKEIPILIESSDDETHDLLIKIGSSLSQTVTSTSSEKRKNIHLAAIFANNFTNYMLSQSEQLLDEINLDFDLLKPLIIETINKAMELGPQNAQTGPARRADYQVIDEHLQLLDEKKQELYQTISQQILEHYS